MIKPPYDANIRKATYLNFIDDEKGIVSFFVDMCLETVLVRMDVRIRGIINKELENGSCTFDHVDEILKKSNNVMLRFYPKNGFDSAPFLVDVYLDDGTFLNKMLFDKGLASKFNERKGNRNA